MDQYKRLFFMFNLLKRYLCKEKIIMLHKMYNNSTKAKRKEMKVTAVKCFWATCEVV